MAGGGGFVRTGFPPLGRIISFPDGRRAMLNAIQVALQTEAQLSDVTLLVNAFVEGDLAVQME